MWGIAKIFAFAMFVKFSLCLKAKISEFFFYFLIFFIFIFDFFYFFLFFF